MTLKIVAAGVCALLGLAVLRLIAMVRHGKPRFWLEMWRQPELAFACIARDPAWQVFTSDPAEATERPGFLGPFRLSAFGMKFAAYVDADRAAESLDRITAELVQTRRSGWRIDRPGALL